MRKATLLLVALILIMTILCGCTEDTKKQPLCVKCGGTATTTFSGPADIMQRNGISISDCKQITSSVYSASVCDSCVGPVVEIKPDAGFSGETPFYSND